MGEAPFNGAKVGDHLEGATEADELTDPHEAQKGLSQDLGHGSVRGSRTGTETSSAGERDPWLGRLVAGRYKIERPIASGGMGRVYLATQHPLGRSVAIKVVRAEITGSRQQFLKRFFLEASASAKLTHPNIIIVHDYGETDDGDVFMAMEYLDGRSLDREIKETAPMPQDRALHIGIQIGRALREAHSKGIIHRDLKPQNVMLVTSGDEHDFVKVLDFGLVKVLATDGAPEQDLTRAGVLLGSPNYMSPEQILGGTVDARTDIYSFGVVLYKMLTGKNPYARDAETEVIYKHVYHPIPSLAEGGATCGPEVEAVVRRCLAKAQTERFESCKDLILALKDARRAVIGAAAPKRKKPIKESADELDLAFAASAAKVSEAVQPSSPTPDPHVIEPVPIEPTPVSNSPASNLAEGWRAAGPREGAGFATVYLRSKSGAAIGPVPLRQVEVLYWARILDDGTPISSDGVRYTAVGQTPALLDRLSSVKQRVLRGENPWLKELPSAPPPAPSIGTPVAGMLECAIREHTGHLCFHRAQGEVRMLYATGRLVEVRSNLPGLTFTDFLVAKGLTTRAQVEAKLPTAPAETSSLGEAIVGSGLLAPHAFLERLVEWVRHVIATVATWETGAATFEPGTVEAPRVPLGLDRFGLITDALRAAGSEQVEARFEGKHNCVVIPAAVDGAKIDDFKLAPKELRVLRSVDGTKTLRDLIGQGSKEQRDAAAKALFFAIEVGLVVFGEDQVVPKERAEAQRLRQHYTKLKEKTPFEILGASESSTDDEVRSRYMELAKLYHPDSARQGAAPELLDAMRQLFTLAQDAYHSIETEERRDRYRQLRELGYDGEASEGEIVRRMLEAEVLFKKAKTLVKMSKYEEGIATMKEAVARKPKDTELKIHLRYFEFLVNKSDRVGEANRAIVEITKLMKLEESEIASGMLILGRLYKVIGREDFSVKFFKKVLKYDPRNHEAESEMRLANLREQKKKKRAWLGEQEE